MTSTLAGRFLDRLRRLIARSQPVSVEWHRRPQTADLLSFLAGNTISPPKTPQTGLIEQRAALANARGELPLWEGYGNHNTRGPTRTADMVRTAPAMGQLFTALVIAVRPSIVVEFGTAAGVSGMYFLAGLALNNHGRLLSFEPNPTWCDIARDNLQQVSDRFVLTNATFEESVNNVLKEGQSIDLAFVDAIHEPSFVERQLDIVQSHARSGAVILLDDIDFSPAMAEFWQQTREEQRFSAAATLGNHVGLLVKGD